MEEESTKTRFWEDRIIRVGFITSVVATLFVIVFLRPLLNLAWSAVQHFGPVLMKGFSDSIYKSAALGQRNHVIVAVVGIVSGVFLGVITGAAVATATKAWAKKELNKIKTRRWIHHVVFVLNLVAFAFLLLALNVMFYANLQLDVSFKQRLTVLAPHLSEQQEENLAAMWASMKTKADYDAINRQLERYAADRNVDLPELLLK